MFFKFVLYYCRENEKFWIWEIIVRRKYNFESTKYSRRWLEKPFFAPKFSIFRKMVIWQKIEFKIRIYKKMKQWCFFRGNCNQIKFRNCNFIDKEWSKFEIIIFFISHLCSSLKHVVQRLSLFLFSWLKFQIIHDQPISSQISKIYGHHFSPKTKKKGHI